MKCEYFINLKIKICPFHSYWHLNIRRLKHAFFVKETSFYKWFIFLRASAKFPIQNHWASFLIKCKLKQSTCWVMETWFQASSLFLELLPILFVIKGAEQRFCDGGQYLVQMPDSSAEMMLGFMCVRAHWDLNCIKYFTESLTKQCIVLIQTEH